MKVNEMHILWEKIMSDSLYNIKDMNKVVMTKPELYSLLSGKAVKCIYVEDENDGVFLVQDISNQKIYIIDIFLLEV